MSDNKRPITMAAMETFISGLHEYLRECLAPIRDLRARVEKLERSLDEYAYQGVWEESRSYYKGNSVTASGSLWICRTETTQQKPGDGPAWQLAVRRGKDAA